MTPEAQMRTWAGPSALTKHPLVESRAHSVLRIALAPLSGTRTDDTLSFPRGKERSP
jgi:hypothetical protein